MIWPWVEVEWLTPRKPVQNSIPKSGGWTALTIWLSINGETPEKYGSLSQNDNNVTTNKPPGFLLAGFLFPSAVPSLMLFLLTHGLTDWLNYWLTDWLIDWLTDRLIDWLIDWLIYWLTNWLTDRLIDWHTDCLTYWLTDIWLMDIVTFRMSDSWGRHLKIKAWKEPKLYSK